VIGGPDASKGEKGRSRSLFVRLPFKDACNDDGLSPTPPKPVSVRTEERGEEEVCVYTKRKGSDISFFSPNYDRRKKGRKLWFDHDG